MAYFRCTTGGSGKGNTLVVTCADDLAGATITCTNGTKTYTKACPSTSPYEVTFYGLEAGTWTISATVSGNTYTTTVVVSDYEAELGGFNWKAWVDLSENYASSDFTDLDDLLSDETAIRELMTIHDCVDYLAGATESADVETIIGNDLCAKWINLRDYALDTLYANEIIADYMDEADKYGYGEWALVGQVPIMTSNTAPYGEAFASSVFQSGGVAVYKVFDGDLTESSRWAPLAGATNNYVGYHFVSAEKINRVHILFEKNATGGALPDRDFIIQASNDNSTWVDLATIPVSGGSSLSAVEYEVDADIAPNIAYGYYRLFCADEIRVSGTYNINIREMQFYKWAPKGNVPIMTSTTAPYGTVSASSNYGSSYADWKAFDGTNTDYTDCWYAANATSTGWLRYDSVNPVNVKKVRLRNANSAYTIGSPGTFTIEGSNTGNTNDWTVLGTFTNTNNDSNAVTEYDLSDNVAYYTKHRINVSASLNSSVLCIGQLQFCGRTLDDIVPFMTSNTTPSGVASANQEYSGNSAAYKAFDKDTSTGWGTQNTTTNSWLKYDFGRLVKTFSVNVVTYASAAVKYKIQGSKDDNEWKDLTSEITGLVTNRAKVFSAFTQNVDEYRYIRFYCTGGGSGNLGGINMDIFGYNYSEREFEEGVTKKWLYDHGVELETMSSAGYSESGISSISDPTKEASQLFFPSTNSSNAEIVYGTNTSMDLSPYSIIHALMGNKAFLSTNYGRMSVCSAKNLGSAISAVDILNKEATIDISSVASGNIAIGSGYQTKYYTLSELWLE